MDYHTPTGTIVNSMVFISSSWAHTLFDTGASHSFITIVFVGMLKLEYESLDSTLSVGVPLGRDCELSYRSNSMRMRLIDDSF